MTGSVVYLNGVPVTFKSSTQKMVSLLTIEAELNIAFMGVQDALFVRNILKSLGLKVKYNYQLAMIMLEQWICNNWSICRRTHHVKVKQNFSKNGKRQVL